MDPGVLAMPALAGGMLVLAAGGIPHCAAMCGAPCAAWFSRPGATPAFLGARMVGYAVAGGLLAGGLGHVEQAAAASRMLQPLWTLWHLLALGWGLVMLVTGRQPGFAARVSVAATATIAWHRRHPAPAAMAAGLAWVAWPCGLLQSALLLASLSSSAAAGVGLMAIFALVTGAGLWLAPALWSRLGAGGQRRAVRAGGAVLVLAAAWALADHSGFLQWCLSSS